MVMTNKELRKFWALAKKVLSDEREIREWLHQRYGVYSPHDLKDSDKEAVIARLQMLAEAPEETIAIDCWNNGDVVFCPQLHELVEEFAKRRNWQWRWTEDGTTIVKPIADEHINTLYRLLCYFTPCTFADAAELLARVEHSVKRNGWAETFAVITTFFKHHEKQKRFYFYEHRKLPLKYFLRLLRSLYAAKKRMWSRVIVEDIADEIAAVAIGAFQEASRQAAKEALKRKRQQGLQN